MLFYPDPLPWQNYLFVNFHVHYGFATLTIIGEKNPTNYYKTEQEQVKSNLNLVSVKKTPAVALALVAVALVANPSSEFLSVAQQ